MIVRPSDSRTYEVYADFNASCVRDSKTHDVIKDVNVDALKTSIRNILMTVPGTRRMLPEFGANLEKKLFEPLDERTAKEIGHLIADSINEWDSDVVIEKVRIKVDTDNSRYDIEVLYNARAVNINTNSLRFVLEQR